MTFVCEYNICADCETFSFKLYIQTFYCNVVLYWSLLPAFYWVVKDYWSYRWDGTDWRHLNDDSAFVEKKSSKTHLTLKSGSLVHMRLEGLCVYRYDCGCSNGKQSVLEINRRMTFGYLIKIVQRLIIFKNIFWKKKKTLHQVEIVAINRSG